LANPICACAKARFGSREKGLFQFGDRLFGPLGQHEDKSKAVVRHGVARRQRQRAQDELLRRADALRSILERIGLREDCVDEDKRDHCVDIVRLDLQSPREALAGVHKIFRAHAPVDPVEAAEPKVERVGVGGPGSAPRLE
jgi:hypothetical protein